MGWLRRISPQPTHDQGSTGRRVVRHAARPATKVTYPWRTQRPGFCRISGWKRSCAVPWHRVHRIGKSAGPGWASPCWASPCWANPGFAGPRCDFALKLAACKRLNRRSGDQLQRKVDPPPRHPPGQCHATRAAGGVEGEARFLPMAPLGGLFATRRCHRVETERGRWRRDRFLAPGEVPGAGRGPWRPNRKRRAGVAICNVWYIFPEKAYLVTIETGMARRQAPEILTA